LAVITYKLTTISETSRVNRKVLISDSLLYNF